MCWTRWILRLTSLTLLGLVRLLVLYELGHMLSLAGASVVRQYQVTAVCQTVAVLPRLTVVLLVFHCCYMGTCWGRLGSEEWKHGGLFLKAWDVLSALGTSNDQQRWLYILLSKLSLFSKAFIIIHIIFLFVRLHWDLRRLSNNLSSLLWTENTLDNCLSLQKCSWCKSSTYLVSMCAAVGKHYIFTTALWPLQWRWLYRPISRHVYGFFTITQIVLWFQHYFWCFEIIFKCFFNCNVEI